MSLLLEAMESCVYVDKTTAPDGYGGVKTIWKDGASFQAAIVLDTSIEARRAEKEGARNVYTICTSKVVTLIHGDIIRRESDDKLFKVSSDGTDKKTPRSAALDMRVVTAEEIPSLPDAVAETQPTQPAVPDGGGSGG